MSCDQLKGSKEARKLVLRPVWQKQDWVMDGAASDKGNCVSLEKLMRLGCLTMWRVPGFSSHFYSIP